MRVAAKIVKKLPRLICKACNGAGKNSKGNECYPCRGTGNSINKEKDHARTSE